MKKIKINGKWVMVRDADVADPSSDEVKATSTGEAIDDDKDDDEKAIRAEAKKLGEEIARNAIKELKIGDTSELSKKLDRVINNQFGDNSKLKQILNGKDLYGAAELTKDEKILGFFHALVTNNTMALKALAEGVEGDGGYLFPNEFLTEIVRDLPEINIMRKYVRVIPMKRDKMDITTLVDGLDVFWTAENAVKSTTTARFTQQTLTAFKLAAILYSSDELIEDSDTVDVVSLVVDLFAEAIGEEEERVIWVGNGTTQPQGIEVARAAGTIQSIAGTGNALTDINRLYRALPRKYRANAAWFMNDASAAGIDRLVDTTGRPIWTPSIADGAPDRLKGKDVVISDWVPERTVFFGDMKRTYFLGDRKRMTVKVSNDTETAFTKDQTAIRVVARIAGRVVFGGATRAITSF